ncbi:hypothetical protein BGP80_10485 [Pseudomonas putida]|uniref:Uncharacterized protein n=1 Tax=Pseudomonas putida TaxID=303 RepID=A0A2S3WBQ8_PSEPU|nr:hypothetical protein BGP80_10485 [Pseudomonas putida]
METPHEITHVAQLMVDRCNRSSANCISFKSTAMPIVVAEQLSLRACEQWVEAVYAHSARNMMAATNKEHMKWRPSFR